MEIDISLDLFVMILLYSFIHSKKWQIIQFSKYILPIFYIFLFIFNNIEYQAKAKIKYTITDSLCLCCKWK